MEGSSFEFPGIFIGAEETSASGQTRFVKGTGTRLIAVILAAAAALGFSGIRVGRIHPLGVVAALAFVVALGVEVWLLTDRPEIDWYGGRAIAESAKTLAWRFAAGGAPFPITDSEAHIRLSEELAALLDDVPEVIIIPANDVVVTQFMRKLRTQSLANRRSAYIEGRIRDQQKWYASKAVYNTVHARHWKLFLIFTEFLGVILALIEGFGYLDLDLASVTSAVIGSGAAWLGMKQHEWLARSYGLASHELALIATRLEDIEGEEEWAAEMADAEEAISREHTMWRAARVASAGTSLPANTPRRIHRVKKGSG